MSSLFLARSIAFGDDHNLILGGGLIALATVIAIRVAWAGRRGNTDMKTIGRKALSVAWVAPALVIVAAVGVRVSPELSTGEPVAADTSLPQIDTPQWTVEGQPWTTTSLVKQDDADLPVVLTPIASGPWSSAGEARQDALERAAKRLKVEIARRYGKSVNWDLPIDVVEQSAIVGQIQTTQPHNLSTLAPSSDMHYCVVQLEISEKTRGLALNHWKRGVGVGRLIDVGTIAGLLCLLVIIAHLYLRLDFASDGAHRGKLQLAAISAMTAAGLAASTVISA
jgi:hypothetical protein